MASNGFYTSTAAYGPLSSGSNYSGKVCTSADADWFKVNVTSPGTISLSLSVPSSNDYDLELYGPSSNWVAGSNTRGNGLSESISYNATATGTYYLRVYGYPSGSGSYNATSSYTLSYNFTTAYVKTFTIFNDGSGTLNVSSIQKENNSSWLSFSPNPPFSISAGNSQIITVTVDSSLANYGTNTDRLIVYSDDPDENPYPGGVNITLTRTATTYTVTPNAGSGGTISPATAQTVNSGSTTSFTVTPNSGYSILSVTGCGGTLSGNTYTTGAITSDCTVTASFTLNAYTLTYTAGANGSITGTSPQTVNNGSNGSAVTAVPAANYHFVNWSDASTANPRTDTSVTANVTVTANFAIDTFAVNFVSGGNGTLTGTASQTINYGGSSTAVTAVPSTGYHFVNWAGTGGFVTTTSNPLTVTNVTAAQAITANFAINTYTLAYTSGGNGTLTGTSPQTVNHGSTGSAVTAAPASNYHFVNWSDGLTANPRTDTNVTGNVTVTANFAITDSTPSDTSITGQPANPTNSTTGNFTFASTETGSSFECRLDGSVWADCTSPIAYTGLAAGSHTFDVRATDIALNTDPTPASYTWSIDLTTPAFTSVSPLSNAFVNTANIGHTLNKAIASGTVTFTWSSGNPDANSPHVYNFTASDMTSGSHTVNTGFALVSGAVYTVSFDALDAAGNAATTASNTNITFDAASASATITSPASGSRVNNSNVGYTLSEAVSSGNIVFTRTGGNADAASPHTYTLAGGELSSGTHSVTTGMPLVDGAVYRVSIENVFDIAGNTTAAVSNTSVTYDSTSVAITNATPAANSAIATATVSYTLSEQAQSGTVTFTRTGGNADPGSPHVYTLSGTDLYMGDHTIDTGLILVDGAIYTVSFDATDTAGNAATTVSNAMVLFDNIHDITVTISGNGAITPSGATGVSHGETRTFTATPDPGYHISSVTGCGGNLAGNTFTSGAITADCAVTANFAIDAFTVTPTAGSGGAITPSTPQTLNYGSTASFTVTPKTGYHINTVTGCNGTLSGSAFTTEAITADCSVVATFASGDTTPPAFTSTSPASNSQINTVTVGYTLSEAVASGKITFARTGGSADSASHIYNFTDSDKTVGTHSVNTGLALINAGIYTVTFEATDLAGNAATVVSNTGIVYDNTSASVVINSPSSNSRTNSISVSYTLNEDITSGEVVFTRTGGTADGLSPHKYTLAVSDRTSGSHTINTGVTLIDGAIYTVGFENVTDKAGNATASVSNTNITYDSTAVAINNTSPASNGIITNSSVGYMLSEAATSGKVTFTRSGGSADSGSPHVYTLSGPDLYPGSHTINTNQSLVDGAFYTVSFDATDMAGNPATTVSNAMVFYDSSYGTGPTGNVDNRSYSIKRVDGYDLIKLSIAFGSKPGDANWNPVCDISKEGLSNNYIDGLDMTALGKHFGEVQ